MRKIATASLPIAFAWLAACSEPGGAHCYPGDYLTCACPGATQPGVAICKAGGIDYGTCDCSGAIVDKQRAALDASFAPKDDSGAEAGSGGLIAFMGACAMNEQCTTGLCFRFNAKGPHCSKPCTSATDCEAPSTGCNGMGVCKVP